MWVVYCWEHYEGEWDHTYFKSKANAEAYIAAKRTSDPQQEREIAEIEFFDEDIENDFRNVCP